MERTVLQSKSKPFWWQGSCIDRRRCIWWKL